MEIVKHTPNQNIITIAHNGNKELKLPNFNVDTFKGGMEYLSIVTPISLSNISVRKMLIGLHENFTPVAGKDVAFFRHAWSKIFLNFLACSGFRLQHMPDKAGMDIISSMTFAIVVRQRLSVQQVEHALLLGLENELAPTVTNDDLNFAKFNQINQATINNALIAYKTKLNEALAQNEKLTLSPVKTVEKPATAENESEALVRLITNEFFASIDGNFSHLPTNIQVQPSVSTNTFSFVHLAPIFCNELGFFGYNELIQALLPQSFALFKNNQTRMNDARLQAEEQNAVATLSFKVVNILDAKLLYKKFKENYEDVMANGNDLSTENINILLGAFYQEIAYLFRKKLFNAIYSLFGDENAVAVITDLLQKKAATKYKAKLKKLIQLKSFQDE